MPARYAIGIDLGTTNCALAYVPLPADPGTALPPPEALPIAQLTAASTIEARAMLPSFLYLASTEEAASGAFDLPWSTDRDFAVGEFARRQAADAPARTVSAAKSWLCHSRVDRHQAILPFEAPSGEVAKISPVEASRRYLEHLTAAWNASFSDAPLAEQIVVLTVPASFDSSARELTREAARAAGLPDDFVLLEEPQAAVYAWLADQGERWRRRLSIGDLLLVCDVGGGTTDFTLIRVEEQRGELMLRRVAVGNHILVGGDNMDLAIAHELATSFAEQGAQLDPWQSVSLWHACRAAKEALLSEDAPDAHPVTILGRGRRLIAGTLSLDLTRERALDLLVEGFFPHCGRTDKPARRRASGFRELGLPFEADTAITRHLAAFLAAQGDSSGPARPTHVLFNGGAFRATPLRDRLLQVLGEWFAGGELPQTLVDDHDLDLAVARGAAYYGLTKHGRGVRIRGGTARAYYVGIETAGLAIPGAARPLRLLCVAPMGMEEGAEHDVPGPQIGLVTGEPAVFRFFSSSVRRHDVPGTLLTGWAEDEIAETDSLEAALPPVEELDDGFVPVQFFARVTELGVLELWCTSSVSHDRWKLEFSVREASEEE